MATRPNTTATFIAQLLAPLPEGVEQANAKPFIRTLTEDMGEVWFRGMQRVSIAKSEREAANMRRLIALRELQEPYDDRDAESRYFDECARQMLVPAPGKGALRWKESTRKFGGGRPEWEDRIAADKAWLGIA